MQVNIKRGASRHFKWAIAAVLFTIIIYRFFEIMYLYFHKTISDRMLLGVSVVLLCYLWVQEIIDKQALEKGYEKLITVQNKLRETNLETIRSLALAEEAKDPYTRGHSARVAEYACMIAKKLGFSKAELGALENAAILHDIGKMGIADSILHKKGKLNIDEWEIVKKHPSLGLDILSPLEFLSEEKEIIRHHHERYDGKGYPAGLKGEKIPLGSRILGVADSFDAMRSHRPYRDPLPEETVLAELKNNAGTQFDPKIVEIILEIEAERKGII